MNNPKDVGQLFPESEDEPLWDYLTPPQRLDLITDVLATWAVRLAREEGAKAKKG